MSTVTNNTTISQVGSITRGVAVKSVGSVLGAFCEELFTGDVTLNPVKFRVSNPNLMYSTPQCSRELADLFGFNSDTVAVHTTDMLKTTKSCLVKALAESSFSISDVEIIIDKLKYALHSTNQKTFDLATKELVAEIQAQHTDLVNKTLIAKVRESAAEIGFMNARIIESTAHKTVLVAENNKGEAIVNEITTDKSLNIHHAYETIGITEKSTVSCDLVKKQFQDKLASKGVVATESKSQSTAGVPLMQSSKKAFEIISKRQKNDISRTRKLNHNNRIHNR